MIVNIDKLAEAFIGDESPSEKKSLIPMEDLERKKINLQEKLDSGQANENFRRVNLKKKVYVRGHKKMNYETYKKNKFKELNNAVSRIIQYTFFFKIIYKYLFYFNLSIFLLFFLKIYFSNYTYFYFFLYLGGVTPNQQTKIQFKIFTFLFFLKGKWTTSNCTYFK